MPQVFPCSEKNPIQRGSSKGSGPARRRPRCRRAQLWQSFQRRQSTGGAKSDAKALDIASELARSQHEYNLAEGDAAGGGSVSVQRREELEEKAFELHVEGWEYVSEHALAREYVLGAADVISIV